MQQVVHSGDHVEFSVKPPSACTVRGGDHCCWAARRQLRDGTGIGTSTGAAAEQVTEPDWSLVLGDPMPPYLVPSAFERTVVCLIDNPNSQAQISHARTLHQEGFGREASPVPTAGWSILYRLLSADGRVLALIEPSSQADRAFNPTYRPEPIWVSVTSHRNSSGERKHTWNYLQC